MSRRNLDQHLTELTSALKRLAEGEADETSVDAAFDHAYRAALRARPRRSRPAAAVSFAEATAANLKNLRQEAGIMQADLAAAMSGVGFPWDRQRVADSEFGPRSRRLTLEEVAALAGVFAVPMVTLLLPPDGTDLQLTKSRRVPADVLRELMLGRGGRIGTGGPRWGAAAFVAGLSKRGVVRPAVALWSRRTREGRK